MIDFNCKLLRSLPFLYLICEWFAGFRYYTNYSIFDRFETIASKNRDRIKDHYISQAEKWGAIKKIAIENHLSGRDAARFFAFMM